MLISKGPMNFLIIYTYILLLCSSVFALIASFDFKKKKLFLLGAVVPIDSCPKDDGLFLRSISAEDGPNNTSSVDDDSIIDVTGWSFDLTQMMPALKKYESGIPIWNRQDIKSINELDDATLQQKEFYRAFSKCFSNGIYLDLEGNISYAFILFFDLLKRYDQNKNLKQLKTDLNNLAYYYPQTKSQSKTFLAEMMGKAKGNEEELARQVKILSEDRYSEIGDFDNHLYWRLGSKFESRLGLTKSEVDQLNILPYRISNFLNIEFCCLQTVSLYVKTIIRLKSTDIASDYTIENEIAEIARLVTIKHYCYKPGTSSYDYTLVTVKNEIYNHIFKYCENAVREKYGYKRKINTDLPYPSDQIKAAAKHLSLQTIKCIHELIDSIPPPDEYADAELNILNPGRWKVKLKEIINSYKNNPEEFETDVMKLASQNNGNPSIGNIFLEASKFIADKDKQLGLSLFIRYIYHDLLSPRFNNTQLTKSAQKLFFESKNQLQAFERTISALLVDKNIGKALSQVPLIYEEREQSRSFDESIIEESRKELQQTVELLSPYLSDEFEDEDFKIQSEQTSDAEVKIQITPKLTRAFVSPCSPDVGLSDLQRETIDLLYKNGLSVSKTELENFARSRSTFCNSLIESINQLFFNLLDDVLIEEDEENYTINRYLFQKICKNDG